VTWGGGADYPGPENFGTAERPVYLSGGALNDWIYGPSSADSNDRETYVHRFHLIPGEYAVGPARDRGGKYVQGSDNIYIQTNLGRPNRKVQVFIKPTSGRAYLKQYGMEYTQEETDAWGSARQLATIFVPDGRYLDHFEMEDIDVDTNWVGQGYAAYGDTLGFKMHGMQLRANSFVIRRCRFVNAGSNGGTLPGSDALTTEAFPLNTYSLEARPGSCLVEDCEIRDFHSEHGGYATMIAVCPFTAVPEARPVKYFTEDYHGVTPVVTVWNCKIVGTKEVNGFGVSGYAAYAGNGALFVGNTVTGCGLGSNFDTGGVLNVELRDNVFINCGNAIQFGTPTGALSGGKPDPMNPPFMYNFIMRGNELCIRRNDDRLSPDYPDRVKGCFLHIRNNAAGVVLLHNRVWVENWKTFAAWSGATAADRYWRFINLSGEDPYNVPGYYGTYGPANKVLDDLKDGRATGNVIVPDGEIGPDGLTKQRWVVEVKPPEVTVARAS
jgi:hypothetical protein